MDRYQSLMTPTWALFWAIFCHFCFLFPAPFQFLSLFQERNLQTLFNFRLKGHRTRVNYTKSKISCFEWQRAIDLHCAYVYILNIGLSLTTIDRALSRISKELKGEVNSSFYDLHWYQISSVFFNRLLDICQLICTLRRFMLSTIRADVAVESCCHLVYLVTRIFVTYVLYLFQFRAKVAKKQCACDDVGTRQYMQR